MQIRPNEVFPIIYLISDPSDTNTYYVRSVMRNSVTGQVMKIGNTNYVNLVRSGTNSRRFSTKIQAPGDPGNFGTWIDIVTTVYTDAAYTVISPVYMETCDRFLIQERWTVSWGGGGGWGDWSKSGILEKVEELFAKSIKSVPTPTILHTDLSAVLDGHKELSNKIDGIRMPEPVKIDLETHTQKVLQALRKEIQAIDIPIVDLKPILKAIAEIDLPEIPKQKDYEAHFEKTQTLISELKKVIPQVDEIARTVNPPKLGPSAMQMRIDKLWGKADDERIKRLLSI